MGELRLDLNLAGFDSLTFLDQLIGKMDEAADAQDRLMGSQKNAGAQVIDITDKFDKQARAVQKAADPWERLAKARERYNDAVKKGDAGEMRAAEYRMVLAQRGADRANSTLDRARNPKAAAIKDLIYSSRVNFGAAQPLVGKLKSAGLVNDEYIANMVTSFAGGGRGAAAGGGMPPIIPPPVMGGAARGMAGAGAGGSGMAIAGLGSAAAIILPLAAAAFVVVGAFAIIGSAARAAAQRLQEISGARFASGGSGSDLARISAITGMSPGAAAAAAKGWYNSATSDGGSQAALVQAGINPTGGPWGNTNSAEAYAKALEYARSIKDDQEALRFAMRAKLPEEIVGRTRAMSDETFNRLRNSNFSPDAGTEQWGADFSGEMQIAMNQFKGVLLDLQRLVLPIATKGLRLFNNMFEGLQMRIHGFIAMVTGSEFWKFFFGNDKENKQESATDRNTKAIERLTDRLPDGNYGYGAESARRAIPAGLETWQLYDRKYTGERIALGGISL